MDINYKDYDVIIGYAIGQQYHRMKPYLDEELRLNFLSDKKWIDSDVSEYDGIPIIQFEDIKKIKSRVLIIVFAEIRGLVELIKDELCGNNVTVVHSSNCFPLTYRITSAELKQIPDGIYKDENNNSVEVVGEIPDSIVIVFNGKNNNIFLKDIRVARGLELYCGSNGKCIIEEGTSIIHAIIDVSDAKVMLGKDCMLSYGVRIRTHDNHHIFDMNTKRRINYPKDVIIGNQVWIGYDAVLLAGACIGDGSVVGQGTITSSKFGDHVVIAGSPAKLLRENIIWSRDNTFWFDREIFDECIDQNALKYM